MQDVYLLLGSNEGNRMDWLERAMQSLSKYGTIAQRSAIYQTAAWGLEDQPAFLNMTLRLQTELTPRELLAAIAGIEAGLGRQRTVRWGQRTLDIDILFFGNEIINQPDLTVPHPRLRDRRFALVPLQDIAPNLVHPVLNKTITQLLQECTDPLPAEKYNGN